MATTERQLTQFSKLLVGTPLMVRREKLEAILGVLGPRLGLSAPTQAASPEGSPRSRMPLEVDADGIARIEVVGSLTRRAMPMAAFSGLSSYDRISRELDAALAMPSVRGIFLEVDSPGGEAGGVFDLADKIRAARGVKPIVAHAGEDACSAAYALASAADQVYTTQTGCVGSIGVFALHVDESQADAAEGRSYTYVHAGAKKVLGNPHEPLSPEAKSQIQEEVDRIYGLFVESVAASRPQLNSEQIRAQEGGVFYGPKAEAMGLVDGIKTKAEAREALLRRISMDKELEAAQLQLVAKDKKIEAQAATIENLQAALESFKQAEADRVKAARDTKVSELREELVAAGVTPPTAAELESAREVLELSEAAGDLVLNSLRERCLASGKVAGGAKSVDLAGGKDDATEVLEHQAEVMRKQGYSCEIKDGVLVVHGKE